MLDPTAYSDYREYLKDTLAARCQNNGRYSLRALARDLGINPPRLSEVLNRKKNLSLAAATGISERLGLGPDETSYFIDLVQASDARNESVRQIARLRLKRHEQSDPYRELRADVHRVIADWYHFAILELTFVEGFQSDCDWIAKALRISIHETEQAVQRLLRLKLLEQDGDGHLTKSNENVTTTDGVASDSIRKANRQILNKALQGLEQQPLSGRDYSTMTMAIDPAKIPAAKERITKFRRELCEFLESDEQREVYCLAIQLFGMSDVEGVKS